MTITLSPGQDLNFDADDNLYPTGDGKPMAETDLHQDQMIYIIQALKTFYQSDSDVYVAGNNFLYYEQGNPRAVVSPDGYVVFGVPKRRRNTYMLWKEGGVTPAVVFEVTSKKTKREDVRTKRPLYENVLRVPEYFQFDPTGDYLRPRLQGLRLIEGQYQAILLIDGRLHSEQLGLDLVQEGEIVRLFDPVRNVFLLTHQETSRQAEQETLRADMEAQAREEAEAEIIRLRAELEALQRQ